MFPVISCTPAKGIQYRNIISGGGAKKPRLPFRELSCRVFAEKHEKKKSAEFRDFATKFTKFSHKNTIFHLIFCPIRCCQEHNMLFLNNFYTKQFTPPLEVFLVTGYTEPIVIAEMSYEGYTNIRHALVYSVDRGRWGRGRRDWKLRSVV